MQTPQNYNSVANPTKNCPILEEHFKSIPPIQIPLWCAIFE